MPAEINKDPAHPVLDEKRKNMASPESSIQNYWRAKGFICPSVPAEAFFMLRSHLNGKESASASQHSGGCFDFRRTDIWPSDGSCWARHRMRHVLIIGGNDGSTTAADIFLPQQNREPSV